MDRGSDEPIPPVHLSPEEQEFVRRQVDSGMYRSAKDVVGEALRQMRETEEFIAANRDEFRAKIEEGLHDLDRGDVVDGEALMDELDRQNRERIEERRKKRA